MPRRQAPRRRRVVRQVVQLRPSTRPAPRVRAEVPHQTPHTRILVHDTQLRLILRHSRQCQFLTQLQRLPRLLRQVITQERLRHGLLVQRLHLHAGFRQRGSELLHRLRVLDPQQVSHLLGQISGDAGVHLHGLLSHGHVQPHATVADVLVKLPQLQLERRQRSQLPVHGTQRLNVLTAVVHELGPVLRGVLREPATPLLVRRARARELPDQPLPVVVLVRHLQRLGQQVETARIPVRIRAHHRVVPLRRRQEQVTACVGKTHPFELGVVRHQDIRLRAQLTELRNTRLMTLDNLNRGVIHGVRQHQNLERVVLRVPVHVRFLKRYITVRLDVNVDAHIGKARWPLRPPGLTSSRSDKVAVRLVVVNLNDVEHVLRLLRGATTKRLPVPDELNGL